MGDGLWSVREYSKVSVIGERNLCNGRFEFADNSEGFNYCFIAQSGRDPPERATDFVLMVG